MHALWGYVIVMLAIAVHPEYVHEEYYKLRNVEEGPDGARYGPDAMSNIAVSQLKKRKCFIASSPIPVPIGELPEFLSEVDIDWRSHAAVTPIQQQHPFGTCWAISAVAVMEGVMVVQGNKTLQKLSEQQLISCSPSQDGGSQPDVLWNWMVQHTHGSLTLHSSYSYNRTCNFFREQLLAPDGTRDGYMLNCTLPHNPPVGPCPPCHGVSRKDGAPPCKTLSTAGSNAKVSNWGFVQSGKGGNDDALVVALLKYGPGMIGVDATCLSGYLGGVIQNCSTADVDHAVTVVGAGTTHGKPYWLVKNSWGTTFGEQGFFRVERNKGQLGINGAWFACFSHGCNISVGEGRPDSVVI